MLGTAFLLMAVVGSGIAATRLSPHDALILALQSVSAAFNPVVTLVDLGLGRIAAGSAATLIAAQVVGGAAGAVLANLMFDLDPVSIATKERSGGGLLLGEVIATFGLVLVIFALVRSGRDSVVAYAVGGYIVAAYWFTSSTSFANPAVTVARTLSDTFAGIAPRSVPLFVVMQLVGGALGLAAARFLYPWSAQSPESAR
jgi:glycerol uptake facilitator-like aquaporin